MPEDFIKRDEYNKGQERVHDRIDKISECASKIEVYSQKMSEDVKNIRNVVYGNGRDGIIIKVNNAMGVALANRCLILLLLTTVIGACFWVIKETVIK